MSVPGQTGLPDFSRGQLAQSLILASETDHSYTSTERRGPYGVANWPGVRMRVVPAAPDARFRLRWAISATGPAFVDGEELHVQGGKVLNWTTVNRGPLLYVDVDNNTGAASSYTWRLQAANVASAYSSIEFRSTIFAERGTVVAAATTTSVFYSAGYVGPAMWWVFTDASVWTMTLFERDYAGATGEIAQIRSTSTPVGPISVVIPPRIIRLDMVNSDAAARNFWSVLTPVYV